MTNKEFRRVIAVWMVIIGTACCIGGLTVANTINGLEAELDMLHYEWEKSNALFNELLIEYRILESELSFSSQSDVEYQTVDDGIVEVMDESPTMPSISDSVDIVESAPTSPDNTKWYDLIPLEKDLIDYMVEKAISIEFPPEMLFAMAYRESTFRVDLYSSTSDYGLLQVNQINVDTFIDMGLIDSIEDLYDPYKNVDCSIAYLHSVGPAYYTTNTLHEWLMRYNMGPTGAQRNFDNGFYTSTYSRRVVETAIEYGYSE